MSVFRKEVSIGRGLGDTSQGGEERFRDDPGGICSKDGYVVCGDQQVGEFIEAAILEEC